MREAKEYQEKVREQKRKDTMLKRRSVSTARLHDISPIFFLAIFLVVSFN